LGGVGRPASHDWPVESAEYEVTGERVTVLYGTDTGGVTGAVKNRLGHGLPPRVVDPIWMIKTLRVQQWAMSVKLRESFIFVSHGPLGETI